MMGSVGVQACVEDSEGLLGVIGSLQHQLASLLHINTQLPDPDVVQDSSSGASDDRRQQLAEKMREALSQSHTVESMLTSDTGNVHPSIRQLEEVINDNEKLSRQLATGYGDDDSINEHDVENEGRLAGFVEGELFEKMEELSVLYGRLNTAKQGYLSEKAGLTAARGQFETEKDSLDQQVDHLKELLLARTVGSHSGSSPDAAELTQRIVDYHLHQVTHRQILQQLGESRGREADLEQEISSLVKRKRELWTRCLNLENVLEQIKDTSDETTMLHPVPAFNDLPEVTEGRFPTLDPGLDQQPEEIHFGRMLHRSKLSINLSVDEPDDFDPFSRQDSCLTDLATISEDDVSSDDNGLPHVSGLPREVLERLRTQHAGSGPSDNSAQQANQVRPDANGSHLSFIGKLRKRFSGTKRSAASVRMKGNKRSRASQRAADIISATQTRRHSSQI